MFDYPHVALDVIAYPVWIVCLYDARAFQEINKYQVRYKYSRCTVTHEVSVFASSTYDGHIQIELL